MWSGRSFVVRDVGQSAIRVTALCLCDVTAKRWYLKCLYTLWTFSGRKPFCYEKQAEITGRIFEEV